jgi:membrane-associated phospholipid phosphatase
MKSAEACSREQVFLIDQPAIDMTSRSADGHSFTTQNLSGYIALSVPALWQTGLAIAGKITPTAALIGYATDLVIIIQSVSWNGALNETARLVAQRPRPFVYANPSVMGVEPSNYTSFYSGHTSFSAAAGTATVLALASRGAPNLVLLFFSSSALVLAFLTGLFRVLAGRHFTTDVIIGGIAGIIVSSAIAFYHRSRAKL